MSSLVQIMAWCLMAPSHYLNQMMTYPLSNIQQYIWIEIKFKQICIGFWSANAADFICLWMGILFFRCQWVDIELSCVHIKMTLTVHTIILLVLSWNIISVLWDHIFSISFYRNFLMINQHLFRYWLGLVLTSKDPLSKPMVTNFTISATHVIFHPASQTS